jgi:hypothetical protein
VGGRPGIPVHVTLTGVERQLNDTNKLWHELSRSADDLTSSAAEGQVRG